MPQKIIQIETYGVIRSQEITLSKDVSLIYGFNNCGKTTLLKEINNCFDRQLQRNILSNDKSDLALYIPTNRLMVNRRFTKEYNIPDREILLNYKKDIYEDFALHLNVLRENLFQNKFIRKFILRAVNFMFATDIEEYNTRLSDGIENIINIYLNIIWMLTWDIDYRTEDENKIEKYISERSVYILIDEIEMFLHVKIQDKFIECIKKDFPCCTFIFTTHSPLLLTRYKDISIYELRDGLLELIDTDYYFADLDSIYESLFNVKELPDEAARAINYFNDIILDIEDVNKNKLREYIDMMQRKYPNIAEKYNRYLLKAEMKAEIDK